MQRFYPALVAVVIATFATGLHSFLTSDHGFTLPSSSLLIFAAACVLSASIGQKLAAAPNNTSVNRTPTTTDSGASGGESGTVKWFNSRKGFGFIIRPDGSEIFVHFKSIVDQGNGRRKLEEGQQVSFDIGNGKQGLQAENVRAA